MDIYSSTLPPGPVMRPIKEVNKDASNEKMS